MDEHTQVVVLGTGDAMYEDAFRYYENKYKGIKSSSDTEIEFKSIDDLYCALIRNGKTEFTIKKSKLNEFMDLFNTYVENPEKQGD